jgi:hypothetical protein
MEDVTIHPPQSSVANMRVFPSGIGSKIPRANEALSKATLTRILLGRVRDAGSGAKVQLKSRPYYHAYLLQKGFRRIWLPTLTQTMPVGTSTMSSPSVHLCRWHPDTLPSPGASTDRINSALLCRSSRMPQLRDSHPSYSTRPFTYSHPVCKEERRCEL